MTNPNITTAVICIETDDSVLATMQKLMIAVKRTLSVVNVTLSISNNELVVAAEGQALVTATKIEQMKMWYIIGDVRLSQYIS